MDDAESTMSFKRVRKEAETIDETSLNPSKRLRDDNEQQGPFEGSGTSQIDGHTTLAKAKKASKGKRGDGRSDKWATGRKGKRNRRCQDDQLQAATESRTEFSERAENVLSPPDSGTKKERLPKKKYAILIGFCGAGYNGMQIQNDHEDAKTIEGTLFEALVKAGAVSEDNSDDATKVSLSRAARTDAGVHAACNTVSLKLITQIPSIISAGIELVPHINSFLPPSIRVWDIVRTNNNFNSRVSCDSRVYEYLFPSYVLMPPFPSSALAKAINRVNKELSFPLPESLELPMEPSDYETLDEIRTSFRASGDDISRVRTLLKKYEGTHDFHNYTIGREFGDSSSKRYMINIDIRESRVYDGMEWLSLRFYGQSFMLHQRKMVGLVMLAARTRTPSELIPKTYERARIHIPKAPALGLLLEQPQFGMYNRKVEESNERVATKKGSEHVGDKANVSGNDIIRDQIDFERHRETIDEFKARMIYSRMREEEAKYHTFSQWVSFIDSYPGSDFEYLNGAGVITEEAIQKKGVQRNRSFKEPVEAGVNELDETSLDLRSAETEG